VIARGPAVCFDGRDLIDAEHDACTRWGVTTIPRGVWAPDAERGQYPRKVSVCAEHAAEVWAHAHAGELEAAAG
jgi:hypothetical protein